MNWDPAIALGGPPGANRQRLLGYGVPCARDVRPTNTGRLRL